MNLPKVSKKEFLERLVHETLEPFLFIYVLVLVTEKNTPLLKIIKLSLIVGVIQTLLFFYDSETRGKIREGMTFSVGAAFLSG
jgi:hypothetical protein